MTTTAEEHRRLAEKALVDAEKYNGDAGQAEAKARRHLKLADEIEAAEQARERSGS